MGKKDSKSTEIKVEIDSQEPEENVEDQEPKEEKAEADIKIDVNNNASGEPSAEPKPEPAKVESRDEVAELKDKYLRLAAEFDNYKKRTAREFGEVIKSANRDLLLQLLPVVDHFGMAMQAAEEKNNVESLHKGLELIDKDIKDFLGKMDIKEIESVGKQFDPNIHEAVMQLPSKDHKEGVVSAETQKGYMLGDRVLRTSKVIISSGPPPDKEESE